MPSCHCHNSKQKSIILQTSRVLSFFTSAMARAARFVTKFSQHNSSAASLIPIVSSCYAFQPCNAPLTSRRLFSSSSPPEVRNFKLPPPVNPPDPENPDRATLRAQWDHAVRMYARTYSHAWGTAILAGVSLFGIGWWIKGENPLKALSPTGELKKEETAE